MSFNQFLVILRARWLIAAGIFVAVVVLMAFASVIWPKQYTATASIVIDSKTDPVAQANGNAGGGMLPATYVNTQADIIASERVAQKVVKALKLDQQPEARKLWAKGRTTTSALPSRSFFWIGNCWSRPLMTAQHTPATSSTSR